MTMAEIKTQFAVIRIRGTVGMTKKVEDTLHMLHLYRKNYCTLVSHTPSVVGMLKKIKDFVTYGEVDQATIDALFAQRGELYMGSLQDSQGKITYASRYLVHNGKNYKKFFRLNNPQGGFERRGIKVPYTMHGALGYRGIKMNLLIKKML